MCTLHVHRQSEHVCVCLRTCVCMSVHVCVCMRALLVPDSPIALLLRRKTPLALPSGSMLR